MEITPKPKKHQAATAADCLSTEGVWGKLSKTVAGEGQSMKDKPWGRGASAKRNLCA